MRPVSHSGTHHIVFQLNLRSHVCFDLSSFWQSAQIIRFSALTAKYLFAPKALHRVCQSCLYCLETYGAKCNNYGNQSAGGN